MKIQNYKIDQYCRDLTPKAPAILLYGQDYGLISERSSSIINSYFSNINGGITSLNVIDLSATSIISNPEDLEIEASSISLLNNKKVIRIKNAADSSYKTLEDYLFNSYQDCLVIVISDNLSPRSKLRKLFEGHNEAIVLPCYSDEQKNILNLIERSLTAEGINIDDESKQLLANYLGIDRLITKAEIEKAILYAGRLKKLGIDDISAFLSDHASINIDNLYDLSLIGDIENAYRILFRIQKEGIPAIQIIRAFIRQMQHLQSILYSLSTNSNINNVLDSFKPPIYFKRKSYIKKHAEKWSLTKINKALLLLESAEISCKLSKSNPDIITKQAILSIGLIATN
jgi:DNA polymerase III subunit delta